MLVLLGLKLKIYLKINPASNLTRPCLEFEAPLYTMLNLSKNLLPNSGESKGAPIKIPISTHRRVVLTTHQGQQKFLLSKINIKELIKCHLQLKAMQDRLKYNFKL